LICLALVVSSSFSDFTAAHLRPYSAMLARQRRVARWAPRRPALRAALLPRAAGMTAAGWPAQVPARRLETIEAAGRAAVPFTSGLLIGIGEGRRRRLADLRLLLDLHRRHGHLQARRVC